MGAIRSTVELSKFECTGTDLANAALTTVLGAGGTHLDAVGRDTYKALLKRQS